MELNQSIIAVLELHFYRTEKKTPELNVLRLLHGKKIRTSSVSFTVASNASLSRRGLFIIVLIPVLY